jgi:predicted nucleotidyltransferase
MKFHNTLEELLGNNTKVRILRALLTYPGKEFSESELQRIASIPQPSVHRNAKPLMNQGILNRRRVGKANLYSLNKQHVLYKVLADMFQKEKDLIPELEKAILEHFKSLGEVQAVFLFGSIPKGRERPDSDVDIFVVTKDGAKHGVEVKSASLPIEIQNKFGNPASLMIKEVRELKKLKHKPILQEIRAGREIFNRGGIRW